MAARTLRGYLKLIVMMALALSIATPRVQAQANAPEPAARGRGRGPVVLVVEQVTLALEGLNLTPDQRNKIDPILADARKQAPGMSQELAQADATTRRGRARGIMLDLRGKIVPVLNADQVRSFDQRLQDLRLNPANPTLPAGQRPGQVIEQFYDAVSKLDLDEQQKPKVEGLFTQTRQKMAALRDNPPGDGTAPQKVVEMALELRDELMSALTPPQREQLRALIRESDAANAGLDARPPGAARGGRGRAGRGRGMPQADPTAMQPNMAGDMTGRGATPLAARPPEPDPADLPGVPVGQPAPDFTLSSIDGRPVSLSTYKGKIVLLVFGSYSSPSFRQRAAGLEQIRTSYGTRINVIVVYTKESYPVGEWDTQRNKDEGIAIEQAKDLAARTAEAKKARTTLHLTAPMLIDTMDNSTASTYGGFTNSAILIGRDGSVLHRQKWFEPYALKRYVDEAVK